MLREEAHRLLLNPCLDRPDKHLRFDRDGNALPRRMNGKLSDRALSSIEIFQLKRLVLVEARKARYLDLVRAWDTISIAAAMIGTLDQDQSTNIAALIRLHEDAIQQMLGDDQPYAGMVRWLARPLLRKVEEVKRAFELEYGFPV